MMIWTLTMRGSQGEHRIIYYASWFLKEYFISIFLPHTLYTHHCSMGHFRPSQLNQAEHILTVNYFCRPCESDSCKAKGTSNNKKGWAQWLMNGRGRRQIKQTILMTLQPTSKIGEKGSPLCRACKKTRARYKRKCLSGLCTEQIVHD